MKTRALTFTTLITLWRLARSVTQSTPGASDSPTFQALQPCSSHICQSYLNKCNKKKPKCKKGKKQKERVQGSEGFYSGAGSLGQNPHQRLPLLPRPVELEQFDFTNFAEQSPFSHWFQLENKSTYFRGPPWSIEVLSWRVFHVICNNLTAV